MIPEGQTRYAVRRTPAGGISLGYTSLAALHECPRKFYWSKLHAGHGVTLPYGPPSLPMLYGSMWHAGYAASVRGKDLAQALQAVLDEKDLNHAEYAPLVDEIQRDLDWYWQQAKGLSLTILSVEDELVVPFGRHELRGTPDMLGLDAQGSVVMPDHKTFGVLSFPKGYARIELRPRDDTVVKYQVSRQFPFYMFLWNTLHPEQVCQDALLNLVPSHVQQVLGILGGRSGNVQQPEVHRIPLTYELAYINEVGAQALRDCDIVADALAATDGMNDADSLTHMLLAFRENQDACPGWGGSTCQYFDLDQGPSTRTLMLSEAYESKGGHN